MIKCITRRRVIRQQVLNINIKARQIKNDITKARSRHVNGCAILSIVLDFLVLFYKKKVEI